jgi:uncharacterized protein (TIGR03437 family)
MKNLPLLGVALVCLTAAVFAQAPVVSAGGILNGASFRLPDVPGGGVAPGSIISIFGTNLAASTGAASAVPLPTSIGGTSVTIGGRPAALYFVSAGQINAQVPWATTPGPAPVVVTTGAGASAPVNVTVQAAAPGIFSQASNGKGPGAIQNFVSQSSTPLNNATTAIAPGGLLIIYATGLGAVNNPPADGAAGSGQTTTNAVTVRVGNTNATTEFAGLSPGFVGLYQVNARLPGTLPQGCNVSISLQAAGQVSNTVTVALASSGNCTTLSSESTPPPNSSVGAIALSKTTTSISLGIPGLPGLTQTVGALSAAFVRYGPVAVPQFVLPPPDGGCIVDFAKNETGQGALPDFAGGIASILDAGTLTYTPPGGAGQNVPKTSGGTYALGPSSSNTSGIPIGTGTHAVAGGGGANVGAFNASINVAGQFNGRTDITGTTFSQTAGFTASWDACPDPNGQVEVFAFSLDTAKRVQGTIFCSVSCPARSFRMTSDLLRQLPVSSTGAAGVGTLFVATPSRFTATGLDFGVMSFADFAIFAGLTLGQ